ncbi:MAG: helix-hairpin-helix domain-containing protein [Bacillota bacterium]
MNLGRREMIIIAAALGLLLIVTGATWWRMQAKAPVVIASPRGSEGSSNVSVSNPPVAVAKSEQVIVHISGAVRQPGLYSVPLGARLNDAVQIAGGALAEADLDAVNLAAPLVDGQKYLIPVKGQQATALSSGSTSPSSGKININTAEAKTLEQLPGVGEVRAKAIIEYRQKNGPFRSIEDLKKITGIGDKTFEQLRDQVTVN